MNNLLTNHIVKSDSEISVAYAEKHNTIQMQGILK
jgi:hypothetical protein